MKHTINARVALRHAVSLQRDEISKIEAQLAQFETNGNAKYAAQSRELLAHCQQLLVELEKLLDEARGVNHG